MSGLTCNENFHLGMQRYLHKFMRKEHLYWQALPCLKPWLYTSVSAAGQTSRAVTVPVSSSGLHQAQPPGRGSHRALQPRSSPSLLSRAACHTWWTPQLGEHNTKSMCFYQIPRREQWAGVGSRKMGPGSHRVPATAMGQGTAALSACNFRMLFSINISALQQESPLNLTRKVFEVLPKPDLY